MNTVIHWSDLYREGHDLFGETIGAKAEATILTHFKENPQRVTDAIHHVHELHQAGRIHSTCWGTVAAHLEQHTARRNQTTDDLEDKRKKTRLAERLIANSGHEIPTQDELHDELFGDVNGRGPLKQWANDNALRTRLAELWRQTRPAAQQLEQDAEDQARAWRESHTCPHCGQINPFLLNARPTCKRRPPTANT